jgi:hypothetical protein
MRFSKLFVGRGLVDKTFQLIGTDQNRFFAQSHRREASRSD